MTVRVRSGYWHYQFTVAGKRYSGNTHIRSGEGNRTKALQIESRLKDEVGSIRTLNALHDAVRKNLSYGAEIQLSDVWEKYQDKPLAHRPCAIRQKTNESYWNDFLAYINSNHPGLACMHEITESIASSYFGNLQKHGRWIKRTAANSKLSNATLNNSLDIMKRIFNVLMNDAGMTDNPFKSVQRFKDDKRGGYDAFTIEELEAIGIKSKMNHPDIYHIFMVGLCTGLREGDICTLLWREIDLNNGIITRTPNKSRKNARHPVKIPIIINGFMEYLHSLPINDEYVNSELAIEYQSTPATISIRIGRFLEEECDISTTERLCDREQPVKRKGVHSLRHTFIYLAALSGMPLNVVQSIVGHLTPDMTAHYANHADMDARRNMMAKVPNYLIGNLDVN